MNWKTSGRIARIIAKIAALLFVCAALGAHAALHAQSPGARDADTDKKKITSKSVGTNKSRTGKKSKAPGRRVFPRGFYKGVLLASLFGGRALSPVGSLIEHEKTYDKTVRNGIEMGAYGSQSRLQPGFALHSYYTGASSSQLEFEYGVSSSFGMGASLLNFSIDSARQEVFMFSAGTLAHGNFLYEPLLQKRKLYAGTSLMYLLTYHPLEKRALDPYIALRAGITGFTGNAHAGLNPELNRYSSKIRNGVGAIFGVGVGVNVSLSEQAGIKLEAAYYRQLLQADRFQRSLSTMHVQVGYVVNVYSLDTE